MVMEVVAGSCKRDDRRRMLVVAFSIEVAS